MVIRDLAGQSGHTALTILYTSMYLSRIERSPSKKDDVTRQMKFLDLNPSSNLVVI